MSKCGRETEVYSRVAGYHRPVKNWNKGKQEEYKQRRTYVLGGQTRTKTSPGKAWTPPTPEELKAVDVELTKQEGHPVEIKVA